MTLIVREDALFAVIGMPRWCHAGQRCPFWFISGQREKITHDAADEITIHAIAMRRFHAKERQSEEGIRVIKREASGEEWLR